MDTPSLHIRADRERLLAAIAAADAVVPTTSTKPIQTHLLLEAKDGRVEVTASDSQVGMRAVVTGIEIPLAGNVVVSSRQMAMILKESSSPAVEMQVVGLLPVWSAGVVDQHGPAAAAARQHAGRRLDVVVAVAHVPGLVVAGHPWPAAAGIEALAGRTAP